MKLRKTEIECLKTSFQPLTNLPQTLASKNCQKYQVFETEPVQNYSRQKPSFFLPNAYTTTLERACNVF